MIEKTDKKLNISPISKSINGFFIKIIKQVTNKAFKESFILQKYFVIKSVLKKISALIALDGLDIKDTYKNIKNKLKISLNIRFIYMYVNNLFIKI